MSDRPRAANDGSVPPKWQPRRSCIRGSRRALTILPPPLALVTGVALPADEHFAGYTWAQRLRAERAELEHELFRHLPTPRPVVERHPELWPAAARLAVVR